MRHTLSAILVLASAGCGGNEYGPMMMGPSGMGVLGGGPALMLVSPAGGTTAVPASTSITLRFGAPVAAAMEQYVDLHFGTVAGPVVPMTCGWSPDRTTLTCDPRAPLQPRTTYVIHVGGGMMSRGAQPADLGLYGPAMGGRWLMGGALGPLHGGQPWATMGPGWRHANGSYGMEFLFTTA